MRNYAFPDIHTQHLQQVENSVLQASMTAPAKQEGWVNIDQIKKVASQNGTGYGFVTSRNLNELVEKGKLIRQVKGTIAYWKPNLWKLF